MTARRPRHRQPATELPVARVCVDLPLPHLDRLFDYRVRADQSDIARPGTRVRVRFAGQLVNGWLLERADDTDHPGPLAFLDRVVSAEPVLTAEVLRAARHVASRYAGNLADVLRLAVPPRHARVESEEGAPVQVGAVTGAPASEEGAPAQVGTVTGAPASEEGAPVQVETVAGAPASEEGAPVQVGTVAGAPASEEGAPVQVGTVTGAPCSGEGWAAYRAGAALLTALRERRPARAVWTATAGEDWPVRLAEAAAATVAGGRGAILIVADARDLDRVDTALTATLGTGRHVALSAALGPAERYRRFLRASRGQVPVVAGHRAAALAPVPDLGLVAIWDDGDDLHAEPRAPYPHAREMLLVRAQLAGAAAVVGGFARTAEAQQLLATGWAQPVAADRATVRVRTPAVVPTGDEPQLARDPAAAAARLPSEAWRAARDALAAGAPVLVQVPRRGYLPAVACASCRARARCPHCAGPLELPGAQVVARCRWCARPAAGYACPECGGHRLRAAVTGARRTAEELGRALPGYPVRTSGRDDVVAAVPASPALVVSTPGAEPVADGGYGAVLLLDTWALLTRADLRAGEETLRRWLAAVALARPARAGGRVVVVADGRLPVVQALVRADPGWYAERELAERQELRFPPAARVATVTGTAAAVAELLAAADLPEGAEVLGPVPVAGESERMLVRTPRAAGMRLAAALHAAAGVRSARKAADPVRIQIDPLDLL